MFCFLDHAPVYWGREVGVIVGAESEIEKRDREISNMERIMMS